MPRGAGALGRLAIWAGSCKVYWDVIARAETNIYCFKKRAFEVDLGHLYDRSSP